MFKNVPMGDQPDWVSFCFENEAVLDNLFEEMNLFHPLDLYDNDRDRQVEARAIGIAAIIVTDAYLHYPLNYEPNFAEEDIDRIVYWANGLTAFFHLGALKNRGLVKTRYSNNLTAMGMAVAKNAQK